MKFDITRFSTMASSTGKVHIVETGGSDTVCGIETTVSWSMNYEGKQPNCRRCRFLAQMRPMQYPLIRE